MDQTQTTERLGAAAAATNPSRDGSASVAQVFPGDSEMARLMRAMDWSRTPLGRVENWPQSLRTAVSICLSSRFPIVLWWGPDLVTLYNDGYSPMLGAKHPESLGVTGRRVWAEIWYIIGPMLDGVLNEGKATWSDDQFLPLERSGYAEECYFTFSYSPILDESGGVGGVFCAVTETTPRVLAERRARSARDLAAAVVDAHTAEEVCSRAAPTLAAAVPDLPFAALYLLDADRRIARLASRIGLDDSSIARVFAPPMVDLTDRDSSTDAGIRGALTSVAKTNQSEQVALPALQWDNPPLLYDCQLIPKTALVLPIALAGQSSPSAVLVAGVNPMRALDDVYQGYMDLLVGHLSAGLTAAQAYEEERKRAEALAEIDRAKTAFFSNVSHEFRTPLTLMLGPLGDLLVADGALPPDARDQIAMIHRNGLRLAKLVNTLLDFSRIEAGRAQAVFALTDLAALTVDLASAFRSLIERAGLRLAVDCPPLPKTIGPIYVDRDLWEKIVLNLLSNAFKFTFEGEIAVTLRPILPRPAERGGEDTQGAVELEVRDTGVGIPEDELPRLFDRFHRVQGVRARTYEGSGIGLALVQELVHLHGGTIHAESVEGVGSCFVVQIPTGTAHLPTAQIGAHATLASTALGTAPFVREAERWLPEDDALGSERAASPSPAVVESADAPLESAAMAVEGRTARIVLADDNADMRDYLRRLLGEYYAVEAVGDGAAALAAIGRQLPDLVLADVMMPEIDGFGLLRALRDDPVTNALPVILLSARAGEEATIEGLDAGANDYLIKPFSAREVLSRVAARLEVARARREVAARARELEATFEALGDAAFVYDRDGRIVRMNGAARSLFGLDALPGYDEASPEERAALISPRDEHGRPIAAHDSGLTRLLHGETLTGADALDVRLRVAGGRELEVSIAGAPLRDASGAIIGAVAISRDVTERKRLEREARASAERLRAILDLLPVGVAFVDARGKAEIVNQAVRAIWGDPMPLAESSADFNHYKAWWPDTGRSVAGQDWGLARALTTGEVTIGEEMDIETFDGARKTILDSDAPLRDETGAIVGGMSVIVDITERKRLERRTRDALDALLRLAAAIVSIPGEGAEATDDSPPETTGSEGDETMQRLTALCCQVLASERVSIMGMEPGTELLRPIAIMADSAVQDRQFRAGFGNLRLTERFGPAIAAQLRAGEAVLVDVNKMRADDPTHVLSRRYFLMAPMLGAGGLIGYIGVNFGDETRQYTPENRALALAVAQLVGMVIERGQLLREREEARLRELAAAEANRRMNDFLGIASHELRTPLTSVKGNVQMAERALRALVGADRPGPTPPKPDDPDTKLRRAHVMLERAERQVMRLDRLVGDLLDVSRIQAGKLELRRELCDLLEIVREAVETQRAAWPQRAISLDLPRGASVVVRADADRIGQVVTNYLTNALKYSLEDQPVTVRVRRHGDGVQVEVRDRGPGLSDAQQAQLFERFSRAEGIEQQSGSGIGLGLGLYICKTIVTRHGGAVGVESVPGAGSSFWFTLPLPRMTRDG